MIQYNKRDLPNILPLEELQKQLNEAGYQYFESVAIRSIGVFETLKAVCQVTIMKQIDTLPTV